MSYPGLVPVVALAEQTGLTALLDQKVHIIDPRIRAGLANPAPKLTTLIEVCARGLYR